jgi:purine-binding chemotaxis protein CheW
VLPVVDMKMRLGMGKTERTKNSCILVLELSLEGEDVVAGVLVDGVRAVTEVESSQIEPPPRFGSKITSSTYVRGLGRQDGGIFIILDTDKLFSATELAAEMNAEGAGDVEDDKSAQKQVSLFEGSPS